MAAARFCSECGERIKIKHAASLISRSLISRSFCSQCSPQFNRARLTLIVTPILCGALGFAAGHYTTAREPFYYIGTPVDSASSRTAPLSDAAAHSPDRTGAAAPREQPVKSSTRTEAICGARTKSGKPCQRKVKGGGYCWQHRSKAGTGQRAPGT
jgi:hypothetical protein